MRLALLLPAMLASSSALSLGCSAREETADGDPGSRWTPLIEASWSLEPLSEDPSDIRLQAVERDLTIRAIRPIAPPGTHHTVLYRSSDGVENMIYASGVGTGELVLPDGVGLKLKAGEILALELHLFNVSEAPLEGVSGIEIQEMSEDALVHEAGLFLPGPFDFALPPSQTSTTTDTCTVNAEQTVFALFPHMHQLGTHFKTTLTVGGTPQVLHDAPYYFDSQAFTAFTPVTLAAGDSITTECTWNNTTVDTIYWGESSNEEMCFSILMRYPDDGGDFCS